MAAESGRIVRNVTALSLAVAVFSGRLGAAFADSTEAKEQLCASCHGAHGLPADHTVPVIWGQQPAYLRKQLADYRNGDRESQIMSSIAESLSEPEIAQIAGDFGHRRWPEEAPATPPAAPAATAICKSCHGLNLTGAISSAGAAPRLVGQFSAYLVNTMTAYANGERTTSPVMSGLMHGLSATNRTAIADYLAALR